jgi:hypothetical protein
MKRGKHCSLAKRNSRTASTSQASQQASSTRHRDFAVVMPCTTPHDTSLKPLNGHMTKRGRSTNWRYEDSDDEPHPTASVVGPELPRSEVPRVRAMSLDTMAPARAGGDRALHAEASSNGPSTGHKVKRPKLTLLCVRRPETRTMDVQQTVLRGDLVSRLTPPATDPGVSSLSSSSTLDSMELWMERDIDNYDDILDNVGGIDPYLVHFTLSREDIRWSLQNRAGVVPVTLLLNVQEQKVALHKVLSGVQSKLEAALDREDELEARLRIVKEKATVTKLEQDQSHKEQLDTSASVIKRLESSIRDLTTKLEVSSSRVAVLEIDLTLVTAQFNSAKQAQVRQSEEAQHSLDTVSEQTTLQVNTLNQQLARKTMELHSTLEALETASVGLDISKKQEQKMQTCNLLLEVELVEVQNMLVAATAQLRTAEEALAAASIQVIASQGQEHELQVNKLVLECQLVEAQKNLAASVIVGERQAKMIDDYQQTTKVSQRAPGDPSSEDRISALEVKLRKENAQHDCWMKAKMSEISAMKSRLAYLEPLLETHSNANLARLQRHNNALESRIAELEQQRVSALAYLSRPVADTTASDTMATTQTTTADSKTSTGSSTMLTPTVRPGVSAKTDWVGPTMSISPVPALQPSTEAGSSRIVLPRPQAVPEPASSSTLTLADLPSTVQSTPLPSTLVSTLKPELKWTPYKAAAKVDSRTPSLSTKVHIIAEQPVASTSLREGFPRKRSMSAREELDGSSPTQPAVFDGYKSADPTDERPFKRRKLENKWYRDTRGV